jgi:hypothetical protein
VSDPFKKLVSTLEGRFSGIASQAVSGLPAELGTITEAGLKLDSFKYEIPDYGLAEWLVKLHLPAFSLVGTLTLPGTSAQEARFDLPETEIDEVKLDWQAGVRPGDRVLAIPVNDGNHAVVVCKVVGADG